ncbi:hypothetical protein [Aliagarivorans taiwanensis]|uniref:hypothetical protein n=1 Tax=Aliagarivorans taiwanensis TaxID=561966 RepID=UPI00040E05C7|nr:hypothetical protein [Aliagarivorans taiwanensis]
MSKQTLTLNISESPVKKAWRSGIGERMISDILELTDNERSDLEKLSPADLMTAYTELIKQPAKMAANARETELVEMVANAMSERYAELIDKVNSLEALIFDDRDFLEAQAVKSGMVSNAAAKQLSHTELVKLAATFKQAPKAHTLGPAAQFDNKPSFVRKG